MMKDRAILCVDDEKYILSSLKRLLRKEEYHVYTANAGRNGLKLLEGHQVQVVLTDQRMPELTGIEFLQRVKDLYPDTIRVVLSGYADAAMVVDSINKGEVYRFIPKPWNDDELVAVIRQCFEHYDILKKNAELMEKTRVQNEQLQFLNEKLEDMVEERTMSLQLSQDILEELPIPVVGVSLEGMVVLTNEAARNFEAPLGRILPGVDVADVIPPESTEAIMSSLNNGSRGEVQLFNWNGRQMRLHIKPLKRGDVIRGCLLMLAEA